MLKLFVPALVIVPMPEDVSVDWGTLMLNEFVASVAVVAAPVEIKEVFGADGTVALETAVPCVTVMVLLLLVRTGAGTLILKLLVPAEVTVPRPEDVTLVGGTFTV